MPIAPTTTPEAETPALDKALLATAAMVEQAFTEEDPEARIDRILRVPFPPERIGKLPRGIGPKEDRRKGRCDDCGGYHELPAIHLDYVGHGAITERLLEADPDWHWEPQARDDAGLPLIITRGGMFELWINLTVGGRTKPGVGTCELDQNDSAKVLIGDALRNAGMRFGMALDLWIKGEKTGSHEEDRERGPAKAPEGPVERPCPACGHEVRDQLQRHAENSRTPAWACTNRACTGGTNDRPWAAWRTDTLLAGWPGFEDPNEGPRPEASEFTKARLSILAAVSGDKAVARQIWEHAASAYGYDADTDPGEHLGAVVKLAEETVVAQAMDRRTEREERVAAPEPEPAPAE